MNRNGYEIERTLIELASTTMQVNLAMRVRDVSPAMERRFRPLVA